MHILKDEMFHVQKVNELKIHEFQYYIILDIKENETFYNRPPAPKFLQFILLSLFTTETPPIK